MSSQHDGIEKPARPPGVNRPFIKSNIHDCLTVLDDIQGTEPFKLRETSLADGNAGRQQLREMALAGLLKVVERGTFSRGEPTTYRWRQAGREAVRDYLDSIEMLPCGCRIHIPDTREDPEGVWSCDYCGSQYDEDRFREFVEDGL